MRDCEPDCLTCEGHILDIRPCDENRVGFTKVLPPPRAADSSVTTLILEAKARCSSSPENLVIALQLKLAKPPLPGETVGRFQDLKALLQWGVGGAQHEALVDFLNGTLISVPASTMKISAVCRVGGGAVPFGPDYIASVSLGYGTRSTNGSIPSASHTTTLFNP